MNWKFTSVVDKIASPDEQNTVSATYAKEEEDMQWTNVERQVQAVAADMERQMEATEEAANITERGIKEAAEEAEVKAATAKASAFLSFLVGVRTYRCTVF